MDHILLKTFVEIVNEGSFKGAAKKLYTSNATVSLRMTNLANELSFDPFIKKRNGIVLSDRGMELLSVAREMLILEEKIACLKRPLEHTARLRVGSGSSLAVQNLMQPIIRFRNMEPEIEISLEIYPAREIISRLQHATLDIGITWEKVEREDLLSEVLAPIHLSAVFLTGHPLDGKKEVTMGELLPYPMILREPGAIARKAPDDWLARHNKKAMVLLTLNNSNHVIKALTAGYGGRYAVGIITSLSGHSMTGDYSVVKIRDLPQNYIYAYIHRSMDSEATRQFIKFLKTMWNGRTD